MDKNISNNIAKQSSIVWEEIKTVFICEINKKQLMCETKWTTVWRYIRKRMMPREK